MSCICATPTDEYHGWECEITCADEYGEVEHTRQWINKHDGLNN